MSSRQTSALRDVITAAVGAALIGGLAAGSRMLTRRTRAAVPTARPSASTSPAAHPRWACEMATTDGIGPLHADHPHAATSTRPRRSQIA